MILCTPNRLLPGFNRRSQLKPCDCDMASDMASTDLKIKVFRACLEKQVNVISSFAIDLHSHCQKLRHANQPFPMFLMPQYQRRYGTLHCMSRAPCKCIAISTVPSLSS